MNKYFIKDGKCLYTIVIPNTTNREAEFAANELVRAVRVSCGDFPVVIKECEELPNHCICLGETSLSLSYGVKPSMQEAGPDGFRICQKDGRVFIVGGGSEGVIYGVYEFLRLTLGAEYFAPEEWTIPTCTEALLPDKEVLIRPDIETRVRSLSWSKLDVEAERRFGYNIENGRSWVFWAHSHFKIIPKEKYWKTHREFYTENGEQLCLTAPNLKETMIEEILARLTPERCALSDVLYIMVGHEDNGTFCSCPRCTAEAKKYGGKSGVMMRFVNPIADAVTKFMKENYPNKKASVITFGYGPTIDPPVVWKENGECEPADESVVAHENVGIMLAPLGADWAHSLVDRKYNESTAKSFVGWKVIRPELFVWTYDSVFDDSFIFIDNWKYLAESYRLFKDYGAVYVFDEGHEGLCFNFWHMRNYVRAKLMWNLSSDLDELIAHFSKHFYKEGSPYVMQYFRKLLAHSEETERAYEKKGKVYKQLSYIRTWPDYRSEEVWQKEFLEECIEILEEGRRRLQGKEYDETRNRLEIEMLCPVYLYLELYAYCLPADKIRYYHDFFRDVTIRNGSYYCAEHGVTHTLTNEKKMINWRSYLCKDAEVKYEQE